MGTCRNLVPFYRGFKAERWHVVELGLDFFDDHVYRQLVACDISDRCSSRAGECSEKFFDNFWNKFFFDIFSRLYMTPALNPLHPGCLHCFL